MKFEMVKLGGLLELLTDYHANGAYKKLKANVELLDKPDYAVMIRTTNFEQNDFSSNLKYINKHAYEFLAKSKVYPNDIIMNKIANAGSSYFMPDLKAPVSLAMNLFLLRVNTDLVNPIYLYIYLKINERYVKSFANGSVTKTITKDAVRNLEIQLPDRKTQDQIADIYHMLTRKIELNSQMNETLEVMAQALFKSWFVDFDPVIDNALAAGNAIPDELLERAEQRKTIEKKDNSDIQCLFPDEFELSEEMGWVPKGWKLISFGEFCDIKKGRNITKSTVTEGEVPVIAGGLKPAYYHNKSNVNAPVITVSASGANAGFVNLYYQDIWASDCSYISENMSPFIFTTYSFLKYHQDKVFGLQQGAVQPHVYPKDLSRLNFVDSNESVKIAIEKNLNAYYEKIKFNEAQTEALAKLRDTLLPKLMSGELRIPEAAVLVDEVL